MLTGAAYCARAHRPNPTLRTKFARWQNWVADMASLYTTLLYVEQQKSKICDQIVKKA